MLLHREGNTPPALLLVCPDGRIKQAIRVTEDEMLQSGPACLQVLAVTQPVIHDAVREQHLSSPAGYEDACRQAIKKFNRPIRFLNGQFTGSRQFRQVIQTPEPQSIRVGFNFNPDRKGSLIGTKQPHFPLAEILPVSSLPQISRNPT